MAISKSDVKRASSLIKRLTPSARRYSRYLDDAKSFADHFRASKNDIPLSEAKIHHVTMLPSSYFQKHYLAAFVDRNWFNQIAPSCDAVASPAFSFHGRTAPPLIILPGKSIPKKRGFKSIIEHEIVHVNQGILGCFPDLDSCRLESRVVFRELIKHTRLEYEAHLIQLTYDPTLLPPLEYGYDVNRWSHLRAFTSGLELLLTRLMSTGGYSKRKFMGLISKIKKDLPTAFAEAELSRKIAKEYCRDFDRMLTVAIQNVELKHRPF